MVIKGQIKESEMGLACSQIMLLTLTRRKADCEYNISVDSMNKMAITREMNELSSEYYSKLQSKKVAYYANSQYHNMTYGYLMGYGKNYTALDSDSGYDLKSENSMILTDYKGQVVLQDSYASAITNVLGSSAMNSNGQGGTFSKDKIAEILENFFPGFTAEEFQNVIDGDDASSTSYSATTTNTLTGESTGTSTTVDNTSTNTSQIQKIVDFYYPIFAAAASNGWTTEYNNDMNANDDYVSDALITGSFQLATVNDYGEYQEGTSLTYYVTAGLVQTRTDSDDREEITAWYNAEKAIINEKEDALDIEMDDLSTELESINNEIQSIQSYIDDAISSVFDWGSG
jgi:hypothetical protein